MVQDQEERSIGIGGAWVCTRLRRAAHGAGTVLGAVLAMTMGCAGSARVVAPDALALERSRMAVVEGGGMNLEAVVLDRRQAKDLLHAGVAAREVLPVIFRMRNETDTPLGLARDDFRLAVDGRWELAPALPGRAAALLRDQSGSTGAAMAGFIIFGALAAPSIHVAQGKEDAAVEANRDAMFSQAQVAPGTTAAGYLLFECPEDLDDVTRLELRLTPRDGRAAPLTLPMSNPYAD